MKRQHRIEFLFKTPKGKLETLTVTVESNSKKDDLAALAKKVRGLLEIVLCPEPPLRIESCRDYPVS